MEDNTTQSKPINTQEIKPIKPNRNYLKISLPLVGMVLLVGAAYLTVNTVQQQQDNRSKASIQTTLYKAINMNGPQLIVDGITFQAESSAGVTYPSTILRFESQSISLNPAVSSTKAQMLRSSVWYNNSNLNLNVSAQNGSYQVYLYTWEDNEAQTFTLQFEGQTVASNLNTGAMGTWRKLGPYNVTVSDGNISLRQTGGHFNLSGMEIYKVTTVQPTVVPPTAVPTVAPTAAPTATKTPTPSPTQQPNAVMTINKSSYIPGENVTVYWTNVPNPTAKDWIGLYTPSAVSGDEIGWIYVSCSQTASVARASGNCTFPLPATAPAGQLELRYHPNDTNTVVTKGPVFTLVGGVTPGVTLVPTATKTPTPTLPVATATTAPTTAPTVIANTPAPTATTVPGNTYVNVALLLHGLGRGGDSVNPNSIGNMSPLHTQRPVTVDILNAQNQLVMTKTGTVTFNATAGNYTGNVDLGTQFQTGIYTIKVKTEQQLRGLVSGIQTITTGQTTSLPSLTLTTGDVNNDNQINIVDYNLIVGCYSDLLPPISCNATNEVRADLNDDGDVNQFDYNLFIRELTNLGGQ